MDKNFKDLLTRFVDGNCTAEEREKVLQWYEMIADGELQLDAEERERIGKRMLVNIQEAAGRRKPRHRFFATQFNRVAAAIAVVAVCGLWFFNGEGLLRTDLQKNVASTTDVIFKNLSDKTTFHALPDGSSVQLEPSSTLRFPKNFLSGDRQVYLTGKAFFDIVKDPAHPFYVYTGKIATRVLGTSFFVDAQAGATKVEVKVITGKVSVFEVEEPKEAEARRSDEIDNAPANGVVLSPNQKVDYYIEQGHWVTGLIEDPVPSQSVDAHPSSFVYAAAPVGEILEDIHERFGIEVLTENDNISRCTFTGDMSKMSLYDMLDVISNSIGSTYEVKGTRILVSGKGCDTAFK